MIAAKPEEYLDQIVKQDDVASSIIMSRRNRYRYDIDEDACRVKLACSLNDLQSSYQMARRAI